MSNSIATIIAFYNGSDYIERALDSIVKQNLKSDEVIIVDDGSESLHHDFLLKIQNKYNFVLFRKENGGQGSARNFGVKKSKSKYITFLDQDDYYLPRHNELLFQSVNHADPRFGWVYGDLWHADGDGKVVSLSILGETKCKHPKVNIKEMLSNDLFILPSASLISREAFEDVGGFDSQFRGYEDDDLFIRIFRNGWSNYFVNAPVTAWCINAESTSYSVRMAVSRVRYFKKLIKSFPDTKFNDTYYTRDILLPRFMQMVLSQAIKFCQSPTGDILQYLQVMNDFKLAIDEYDYVSEGDKKLISDIIFHLKNSLEKNAVVERNLIESHSRKGLIYRDVFISGKRVKFLDIEKIRNSNK